MQLRAFAIVVISGVIARSPRRCRRRPPRSRRSRSEVRTAREEAARNQKPFCRRAPRRAVARLGVASRRRRSRSASLGADPKQPKDITCTFEITQLGGTAPKFDCKLENGERLRVKYGRTPEIPSEVAAARLLHALGFGADNVTLVEKVRCYGCPAEPFITMKTLGFAGAQKLYGKVMDTKDIQGLRVGGGRAQALRPRDRNRGGRRLGVLRARSDRSEEGRRAARARRRAAPAGRVPRALGQQEREPAPGVPLREGLARRRQVLDGRSRCCRTSAAAWGPRKVDLEEWEKAPIWGDRASCTTSMDALPYHGATFKPVKITEAGRKHLGGAALAAVAIEQLDGAVPRRALRSVDRACSAAQRHADRRMGRACSRHKVKQITDGPSCPQ